MPRSEPSETADMDVWIEREIEGCVFPAGRSSSCTTRRSSAINAPDQRRSARHISLRIIRIDQAHSPSAGCSCIPAWRSHFWPAAGADGRQVLDPQEIQGDQRPERPGQEGGKHTVNTKRIPINEKESILWLVNLQQSMQFADSGRCVHIERH